MRRSESLLSEKQLRFSRELRRSETPTEVKIWQCLRGRRFLGLKFRRQHPWGPYIPDFYCAERRWAIEIDGGQHTEASIAAHDKKRTEWLASQGITVTRVWTNEVMGNFGDVMELLAGVAKKLQHRKHPHPSPLPEGEGGKYMKGD